MGSIINQSVVKQLSARIFYAFNRCVTAGRNLQLPFSSEKPKLIYKPGSNFAKYVVEQCSFVTDRYRPTIWCFGGHAQTIAGGLFRKSKPVKYRRELVELKDGGEVALDWLDGASEISENPATHPTVLVLPALGGSSRQTAVMHLVQQLEKNGYRVVVFNPRGSAGVPLKTPKMFGFAVTEDLEFVISHVHKKNPGIPLLAVGHCAGAFVLTRYLADVGSQGKDPGLVGAMTVSMPWHFGTVMRALGEPINYLILGSFLTKYMQKMIWRNRALWRKGEDRTELGCEDIVNRALQCKTLYDLNDVFVAPMYGFKNAEAYHESVCLHSQLDAISVPLLCLTAADDPIVSSGSIPYKRIRNSPMIVLALTSRGGHIGFTEGIFLSGPSFADKLTCQYAKAIFERGVHSMAEGNFLAADSTIHLGCKSQLSNLTAALPFPL